MFYFFSTTMASTGAVSSHRGIGFLPVPLVPVAQQDPQSVNRINVVFDIVDTHPSLAGVNAADLISVTDPGQTIQELPLA